MAVKKYDAIPGEAEVITLAEAKKHLNIEEDFEDDDVYISSCISAARDIAEQYLERPLTQTLTLELDNFDTIDFEAKRNAAVTAAQYLDADTEVLTDLDVAHTWMFKKFSGDTYELRFKADGENALPALAESDSAVVVTITTACPPAVKQGMLLQIGDFYQFREARPDNQETNKTSVNLWRPYKSKWAV